MGKGRGEFFLLREGGFCYNARVMAQITIRNVDDNTLAALKRRAAAEGRSLSAVLREMLTAQARDAMTLRERFPNAIKPGPESKAALARMERIWANWESQPRVKGCSSKIIREGREERTAAIEGRAGARKRAKRRGK